MPILPDRADLDHLKKQAKDLLCLYRAGDSGAIARFARTLPLAARRTDEEIVALRLRLHDAQSCVAREYGFASWADLRSRIEASAFDRGDRATRVRRWLMLAYGGDVTGNFDAARPRVAADILKNNPDFLAGDLDVACAAGDIEALLRATVADPAWIDRVGGPLFLPPLVAVTQSRLGQLPDFRERLRQCARHLLEVGADPNQRIGNRFPPASLAAPDEATPLSALYGAAGVNRDPELTEVLLQAGADPNDGESLYHSLENPDCTDVLLRHGARIAGTNALRRALDMPDPAALELLLAHGGDPNEPASGAPTNAWGAPLLRAIALRKSDRHILALMSAGADPKAETPAGIGAYRLALQVGLTNVAEILRMADAAEDLTEDEQFVAACARADTAEARRIQARRPDLPAALQDEQLRLLPDTIAWGSNAAAKVMIELGWPVAARGGDWDATSLNLAVFCGDADLSEFLLANGAHWRERHGHGDDVLGTLSWASLNEPAVEGDCDWVGCARALVACGLPKAERDPSHPERVLIDGRHASFSADVTEVLLAAGQPSAQPD